ncbi:MAG: hypothetical protein ACK501_00945 [Planctomycetota bacterium]|jgi:hypothetical protein
MNLVWLALVLVVVVAVPMAWPHLRQWWMWRQRVTTLARRHGLDAEQTRLVWLAGRRLAPQLPLLVFVQPSLLVRAEKELQFEPAAIEALRRHLYAP